MRKIYFFLSALLAITTVSCSNEEETEIIKEDIVPYKPLVFTATPDNIESSEAETRAIGAFSYVVNWEQNDKISVVDSNNSIALFSLTGGKGTNKGTFSQVDEIPISGTVNAYYPNTLVSVDGNLVWPSEQVYSANMIGMPMISSNKTISSEETNLGFTGLGTVLQIIVSADKEDVVLDHLTLKEKTRGLSGTFKVDNDSATVLDAETEVKVVFGEKGLDISNSIKTVYLYMPAIKNGDFLLSLYAKDSREDTIQFKGSFRRSTFRRLPRVADGFGYIFEYDYYENETDEAPVTFRKQIPEKLENVTYLTFDKEMETKEGATEESPTVKNIASISLPSTVRSLGNMTFLAEKRLEEVELNEGLLTIGDCCFERCNSLESIEIPSTVTYMGSNVFYDCASLEKIVFFGEEPPAFGYEIDAIPWDPDVIIYVPDDSIEKYEMALSAYPDLVVDIKGLSELEE